MQRKEFFKKLSDIYPKIPSTEGTSEYLKKLSIWKVTAKQLDSIYELVSEQCEFYPTIAQITSIAAECGVKVRHESKAVTFLTFDLSGKRCASICKDPSSQPLIPPASENVHLCIPPELTVGYEQASPAEAREAFAKGFLEAGGDPAKLRDYQAAVMPGDDELPF